MKIITPRAVAALLLGAGALLIATAAAADPKVVATDVGNDRKYGYIFDDDALAGTGNNADTAQIRIRPNGMRGLLLRPRVQFVTEMLKSVENM